MSGSTALIERASIPVPANFDPEKHTAQLLEQVAERNGPGWSISHQADGMIHLVRRGALTSEGTGERTLTGKRLSLGREIKPADVPTMVAQWEDQYREEGLRVVRLNLPLGECHLEVMDERTYRCREAIAAKLRYRWPWDVAIKPIDGDKDGWTFELRGDYDPTKQLGILQSIAEETVGSFGWTVDVDPITKTGTMTEGVPPSFPPAIPYPFELDRPMGIKIPIGLALPEHTDDPPKQVFIDLAAAPHGMIGGTTGAGKSVTVNGFIVGALARGFQLVILDVPGKKVDYRWVKPYCRPGGWGCETADDAVTALKLAVEEAKRRADILEEQGLTSWMDIPEDQRFPGILIIVDEASALLTTEKLPGGVSKDSIEYATVTAANNRRFQLQQLIKDIAAVYRFVGVHIWVSNQVSNANTGIGPTIRTNLGNRVLMGTTPSKQNRDQFHVDASRCPLVPAHIANDGAARRGVGVAELEGREPVVFKSYWAALADFAEYLESIGAPTCDDPAPTAAQRTRLLHQVDGSELPIASIPMPDSNTVPQVVEICQSCGGPISATGECRCTF